MFRFTAISLPVASVVAQLSLFTAPASADTSATTSAEQAQTMSEQQAYEIARDAYVYAYPIVTMDVSMHQSTNVPDAKTIPLRAPVNQFAHARTYPRAEDRDVVRYNFDTLYSPVWLDLAPEPIVLSVPDTAGRYYLLPMLDMWTDVFSVVGSRTTGTKAGNFAIVAPGWNGTLPEGVAKIVAPTSTIWNSWPHADERACRLRERPQGSGWLQADAAQPVGQGLHAAGEHADQPGHRQQNTAACSGE